MHEITEIRILLSSAKDKMESLSNKLDDEDKCNILLDAASDIDNIIESIKKLTL